MLRLATQQYHGLAGEAQLLYDLKDVFKLLNILLQEAPLIDHFLCPQTALDHHIEGFKKISFLFSRLNNEYACCEVNLIEPLLTISAISFDWWLNTADGSVKPTPKGMREYPPIAIKSVIPIADRSALIDLQREGIIRVEELRTLLTQFAGWLVANCSMGEITTVPQKDTFFYRHWMEDGGKWK